MNASITTLDIGKLRKATKEDKKKILEGKNINNKSVLNFFNQKLTSKTYFYSCCNNCQEP